MPNRFVQRCSVLLVAACLLSPRQCAGVSQFVEITAEVSFDNWDYWFLSDDANLLSAKGPENLSTNACTTRCVVGPKNWMLECNLGGDKSTLWFTGKQFCQLQRGQPFDTHRAIS